MEEIEDEIEEVNLKCECGNEILCMATFEKDFILCVYYYASTRFSLWRRIEFLFGGHLTLNEVVLSPENASKLADFINNRLNIINDGKK